MTVRGKNLKNLSSNKGAVSRRELSYATKLKSLKWCCIGTKTAWCNRIGCPESDSNVRTTYKIRHENLFLGQWAAGWVL